jgi:hypothetical protein
MPLIHFLLIYNIDLGHLVECRKFTNAGVAAAEYSNLEREYAGRGNFEIVLVGADSIETIRQTHGQYFDGDSDAHASPFLAGV